MVAAGLLSFVATALMGWGLALAFGLSAHAALAVALAAPHSHLGHLLFGYRYLVFSVLALLALARGIEAARGESALIACADASGEQHAEHRSAR